MMTGIPMRAWCAVYQWPGKKKFLFGTVHVRRDGTTQEIESAVEAEFVKTWGKILPDDVPRPRLLNLIPGQIWFGAEEDRVAA